MAETVIAATLELDSSKASKSIKELKSDISEVTVELKKLQDEFGSTSEQAINAAERLKELQGAVKEVNETAEENEGEDKFDSFKEAVEGVVDGVRALNETMQLLGMGGSAVEEAMKKVEEAMEFADKINDIKEGAKSFVALKDMAVDAFKGIKAAIGGTGIGLLLIAVAAIYTYWDKIKSVVSGVSTAQRENLETSTKHAAKEKEKLDNIDNQDNVLKSQGLSEKKILELKAKQVEQTIFAAEAQLRNQKVADDAAQKAADRNRNFLIMLMKLASGPLEAVTLGIDAIGKAFGKDFGLNEKLTKGMKSLASLVFDPEGMKEEAKKSYEEQEKGIKDLQNQKAGYQNQIADLNKQELQKQQAFDKELRTMKREAEDAEITDSHKLAKKQLLDKYTEQQEDIKNSEKTKAQKNELLEAAKKTYLAKDKKLDEDAKKEEADREAAAQEKLTKIREEKHIESITNKYDQTSTRIEIEYKAQVKEINNLKISEDKKTQLLNEALDKRSKLLAQNNADSTLNQLETYKNQANDQNLNLEDRLNAVQIWADKVKEAQFLTEEEKTNILKENAAARKAIDDEEFEHKQAMMAAVSGILKTAASELGEATVAGKVLAVAAATIDTWAAVARTLHAFAHTPIPGYAIAQAVAVGVAGLATVKKIVSVQVPKSSGASRAAGAMPAISSAAPAPVQPQVATTRLPQDQINQIGNATIRAYVLEQDIDQDRSRTTRLNRAARLGG